jgi:hypothetical protein
MPEEPVKSKPEKPPGITKKKRKWKTEGPCGDGPWPISLRLRAEHANACTRAKYRNCPPRGDYGLKRLGAKWLSLPKVKTQLQYQTLGDWPNDLLLGLGRFYGVLLAGAGAPDIFPIAQELLEWAFKLYGSLNSQWFPSHGSEESFSAIPI